MYDGILCLPLVSRSEIVGFADDVALLVVDKQVGQADEMCNRNIRAIEQWLSTTEKTAIEIGSTSVISTRAIKYLVFMIDITLSFREHPCEQRQLSAIISGRLL